MAMGDCGYKCIKYMVFFFNLLFWLAGCAIIGIGIWLLTNKNEVAGDYTQLTGSVNYKAAPILCIVIGIITVVVAFLACCGAKLENQCMLAAYFAVIVVIFCLEITAIVLAYTYRDKIEKNLREEIADTMDGYLLPQHQVISKAIDDIQKDFKCCGNKDYKDWFDTKWGLDHKGSVPRSCCKDPTDASCSKNAKEDPTKIHRTGCYKYVRKYLLNNLHVISGFGIWIAVIQLMGMIFAMCLCCRIRMGDDTYA